MCGITHEGADVAAFRFVAFDAFEDDRLGSCLISLILRSIRYGARIYDMSSIGLLLLLLLACTGMMYCTVCCVLSCRSTYRSGQSILFLWYYIQCVRGAR